MSYPYVLIELSSNVHIHFVLSNISIFCKSVNDEKQDLKNTSAVDD